MKKAKLGELDIRTIFSGVYGDAELPAERVDEMWERFLEWYEKNLTRHWERKIAHYLFKVAGMSKEKKGHVSKE